MSEAAKVTSVDALKDFREGMASFLEDARNALVAVQTLRSNWLQTRGRDSYASPSAVVVYLDNQKLGGTDALRAIDVAIGRRHARKFRFQRGHRRPAGVSRNDT